MGRTELTLRDEITVTVERYMGMAVLHSNSVDSNLSTEEDAAILLCISTTSLAAHPVNSWTSSFSYFSEFLAPAHQRAGICRLLDESDPQYDSEQPARTWDDEQLFERIMWSAKEISSDFLTACYDEQDNRCQLSENWFQQDARHYDEQQKKVRALKEREQLQRLEHLEDLHEKHVTKSLETNHRRPTLQWPRGEGRATSSAEDDSKSQSGPGASMTESVCSNRARSPGSSQNPCPVVMVSCLAD